MLSLLDLSELPQLWANVNQKSYHQVVAYNCFRFEKDYSKYFSQENTQAAARFFFQSLYTLENKVERDRLTRATYTKFKPALNQAMTEKVERLILLNDITDFLDLKMAAKLSEKDSSIQLDIKQYENIYRHVALKDYRLKQMQLVIDNLQDFFKFSKNPLMKFIILAMVPLAKLFGANNLVTLFFEGYHASKTLTDENFNNFIAAIKENEKSYIERLLPSEAS